MNTYTVNVNIGTTIQITLSAEDEDQAEILACEKAANIISNKKNIPMLAKEIEVIDAEVLYTIEDIDLADIAEIKNNET